MVTVIGFVPPRTDNSLDPSEPRHFTVETSVYDASKAAPAHFSVVCFLEDTKRWKKVKTPAPGALLTVTAKIAGRTRDTNLLALRVLDLAYLPRPASAPTPTPTDTPPSKRSDRWRGRVPSTPSKRPRISDRAIEAANPSDRNTTLPDASSGALVFPHSKLTTEPISVPTSPSTTAGPEESSSTPGLPLASDGGARPRRNRHPPRNVLT
ncbi:extracellular membrane protein, 8-cysteine region, CFEM [Pochonia chlamydosporia 170]|nr:extracellular membrane protein, 8-cysteine region, CFEM [Pochonia chlamydosporia 170]OAQ65455.1 extracellular membrane protein, 8-cysteine region, CFEM [Pochonia chlamydosporia 170]